MAPTPTLHALLVGINEYHPESGVRSLRGCVNDVRAMARTLTEVYSVPAEQIVTLANEAATRAAIEEAFRTHLIAPALAWAARQGISADGPPRCLFYFSGHGSQARDLSLQEPDGMDETIVAWDSRTPGVFDIRDWELGAWLDAIADAGGDASVILDCCHAGSGTRDDEDLPLARACPPDLRRPPSVRPPAATRGTTQDAGALPRHVLLAGCRDRELARELAVPEGTGTAWRGAMSFYLQEALYGRRSVPLTWRELHEQMRARVRQTYWQQTPQCEGAIDRIVLGGAQAPRDPFFTVVAEEEGLLWIDGGVLHGITEGSLLRAYLPETRTRAGAGVPLGTLEVVRAGVERSGCTLLEAGRSVPVLARVAAERLGSGAGRARVRIQPEIATAGALEERLAADDAAPWVEAAQESETLRVVERAGALFIADTGGVPLAGPFALADLDGLAQGLAHMARWQAVAALHSDGGEAALAGAVTLEIGRLEFDEANGRPVSVSLDSIAGEPAAAAGTRLVYTLTNRSAQPLYVALYNLTPQFEVYLVWPRVAGAHEALGPGKSVALGRSARRGEQLAATLPEGVSESRDLYKLIVSPADFAYDLLEQGPLGSAWSAPRAERGSGSLDWLLRAAVTGERGATVIESTSWATAEASMRVVAAAPRQAQARAGEPVETGSFQVEPPPGFTGNVVALAPSLAQDGPEAPPGIALWGETFQPLEADGGPVVLSVDCDAASARSIGARSPLRLRKRAALTQPTIAVAWTGEGWYPVGRAAAGDLAIDVTWLPSPAPAGAAQGATGTLRLYLYALAQVPAARLGLHRVRFVPQAWLETASRATYKRRVPGGELRYTAAARVQPGERVGLVLHGFGDDSAQEAHWLCTEMASRGIVYDRVLVFEYESLRTAVAANAERLRDLLEAAGVGNVQDVALDVYAHSMGALIARAWIELLGGGAWVRSTILIAPPNKGTPLASLALLVPWLVVLALNVPGPTPASILVGWAVGAVALDSSGPADLKPDAEILERLRAHQYVARVRYHVVAGDVSVARGTANPDAQRAERWLQTLATGLGTAGQWLFDGGHDWVVGVRSALGLRAGRAAGSLLLTKIVAASHTGYFESEALSEQVAAWLLAPAAQPAADAVPAPEPAEPMAVRPETESSKPSRKRVRFRVPPRREG